MNESDPIEIPWDPDVLLVLVGEYLYRRDPGVLEDDERFMNWLVADLRRRPPSPGDWSPDRVRRVRRRVIERALLERCGVKRGGRAPALNRADQMPLAPALDEAREAGCAPWTELAVAAGQGRGLWEEPCDHWVDVPPDLPKGRYVALGVAGDSMVPALHDGDSLLVRVGTDVRRDSIIVARRPDDTYVVKRVGRVRRREVELLSLNPAYQPIVIPRSHGAVLGTVVMRWCAHDDGVVASIGRP